MSETLVPGEWDVPVTAVDGNVYYLPSAIFITPETGDLLLQNGDVLSGTGGPDTRVLVPDGATVTLRNVCITNITADTDHVWGGITCQGSATIVLQGVNYLRGGHPYVSGLYVPPGKTLVIRGDGTLDASSNGYGAGIGGGRTAGLSCGDIVIEGGTIVATGGNAAAGIGAGQLGTCGNITVTGGSVTAIGGNAAAGIGSGQEGTNGTITVSGGIVNATGGPYGAGIGSGYQAVCGDIAVSGGTVAATGGQYAAGIGSGFGGTCGDITLSGGTTAAAGGQYAPGIGSGVTLTSTGFTATCGDIALEEGVVRVTADGDGLLRRHAPGVEAEVVGRRVAPLAVGEVVVEGRAAAVGRADELPRLGLRDSLPLRDARHAAREVGVQEDADEVRAAVEHEVRGAPDDHAPALRGDVADRLELREAYLLADRGAGCGRVGGAPRGEEERVGGLLVVVLEEALRESARLRRAREQLAVVERDAERLREQPADSDPARAELAPDGDDGVLVHAANSLRRTS